MALGFTQPQTEMSAGCTFYVTTNNLTTIRFSSIQSFFYVGMCRDTNSVVFLIPTCFYVYVRSSRTAPISNATRSLWDDAGVWYLLRPCSCRFLLSLFTCAGDRVWTADPSACWTVCAREYQLEVAASCGGNQRNVRSWRRFGGASFHLHDSPSRGFGLLWRWMQQTLRKCCLYIPLYIASYSWNTNV